MQEIKFRAWDKVNKLYYHNVQNTYDEMIGDNFQNVLDNEDLVVEQYTGLKDKNGVEIYENDVVMWRDGENIRYAQVALSPDITFLTCDYVFRYGRFAYKDTENHLILMGNIHGNPELLEE